MTPKPCDVIVDACEQRDWTFVELWPETGLDRRALWLACVDRAPIDATIAAGLATAFGNDAQYWLDVQAAWDNQEGE